MLDDKLARIKKLIARREEIDTELSELLGISEKTRRGRQPKNGQSTAATDAATSDSSEARLV
jgi:hypothetical protein